jgi:hypothetical protein
VAASLINWDLSDIHRGPQASWTGDYFYLSVAMTFGYFFIDLLWVAFIPISVKSPDTIIKVLYNLFPLHFSNCFFVFSIGFCPIDCEGFVSLSIYLSSFLGSRVVCFHSTILSPLPI